MSAFDGGQLDQIAKWIAHKVARTVRNRHIACNSNARLDQMLSQRLDIIDRQTEMTPGVILPHRLLNKEVQFAFRIETIPDYAQGLQGCGRSNFLQPKQAAVKGASGGVCTGWMRDGDVLQANSQCALLYYLQLNVRTLLIGLAASSRARPPASRRTRTTETSQA